MSHKEGEKGQGSERERTPCEQELVHLKGVFDTCDENRDGFLTLDELCQWIKKLGLHLTREGLQGLLHTCDRNLDGLLDFDEFVVLSGSLGTQNPTGQDRAPAAANGSSDNRAQEAVTQFDPAVEELRDAFLVFDKDANGLISPTELQATLCQLGLLGASTPISRIHSMIRKVDTDGDGEVNFSEFQTMMKGG